MRDMHLYNNSKMESKGAVSGSQKSMSVKSDLRDGMTTTQIANVISNRLISHVEKALDKVKKNKM